MFRGKSRSVHRASTSPWFGRVILKGRILTQAATSTARVFIRDRGKIALALIVLLEKCAQ